MSGQPVRITRMLADGAFGIAWTLVWLVLPVWALLKALGLLLFVSTMAWRWRGMGRTGVSPGLWVGWLLGLAVVFWMLFAKPWPRQRLLHSLGVYGPDILGSHYAWSRLMAALTELRPLGGGWSSVHPVLTQVDDSAWLLRVGVSLGWVPMALLGSAVVLGWLLLAAYLARSPVGNRMSLRTRRLGVALAWGHALAAALYGAWSMGYLYRPMGALAPLAHAGWWVLSAALAIVVWRAHGQRKSAIKRRLESGVPPENAHPPALRSAWMALLVAWLAMTFLAMVMFPSHRDRCHAWLAKPFGLVGVSPGLRQNAARLGPGRRGQPQGQMVCDPGHVQQCAHHPGDCAQALRAGGGHGLHGLRAGMVVAKT